MEVCDNKDGLVNKILQNIFLYVPQKTESYIGLEWLEGE